MIDIADLLATLSMDRPIFHSEADFQHTCAWELHRRLPNAAIRLERPPSHGDKRIYLDIWLEQDDAAVAIELKYKTGDLSINVNDEQFALRKHAAHPPGRYDFIKDIERLEHVTSNQPHAVGWAIFLTNDSTYWSLESDNERVGSNFDLWEGRVLHGTLQWNATASSGTRKGREAPLHLRGTYRLAWQPCSHLSTPRRGLFRYLAVQVRP
ncbi:MAG: hypothetical protein ACR2M3_00235 [Thermomicrobiales bacterium]